MFSFRNIKKYALLSFLLYQTITPIVVIFDLNGVLLSTDRWKMAQEIGIGKLIGYTLSGRDPKQASFRFLEGFGTQKPLNPTAPKKDWIYAMGDGIRLPQIWCDHMKGTLSGAQVIQKTEKYVHTMCAHGPTKKIIRRFIRSIFNPKILADVAYPIEKGVRLITDCAKKATNTIMILSNWSSDGFDEIYKKPEAQAIFRHIKHQDHLMISGKMGMIKPDPAIYEEVKRRLVLMDERFKDPVFLAKNCVFIDDQQENVISARQAGITTLSLADGNYDKIRKELAILEAL